MALALYRKYRPATFAQVVGQEHVTQPLRTALAAGRINHAYLFSGPRGCGKTSSARILARSLNCVQGPTPDPCGVCPSCVALAPEGSGSLDVVELDAASHGGVDDTRELRDRAFYMPAESRYRVFIIDEAHMVTPQGFNALLKIVEEPPEHLVFVFATTEPDKVLTTIRSRTHHYPFRLIPPATLRALLERLCAEEGVTVEPAVFPLVIQAGGGSARDSLSVLDQLLAGAGRDGVTYRHAVALLGVTDAALLDEIVDALAAGDGPSVFGVVDKVVEAGHDPRRFAADLLQRLRDLVILGAVPDAAGKGLIDAPGDQLALMTIQAEKLGRASVSRFAELLHTGLIDMRGTTSPRLVLELLCARMLLPAASSADGAVLQRLERMERRMSIAGEESATGGSNPPVRRSAQVAAQQGTQGTSPTAGPTSATPRGPKSGLPPTDRGPASTVEAGERHDGHERSAESVPPQRVEGPERAAARTSGPLVRSPAAADLGLPPPPRLSSSRARASNPEPGGRAGENEQTVGRPEIGLQRSAAAIEVTDVRRVWPEVLAAVQRRRRTTQILLEPAVVVSVSGGALYLTMPSQGMARRVVEPANADLLRAALKEVLGVDWAIRCDPADARPPGPTPNPSRSAPPASRLSEAVPPPDEEEIFDAEEEEADPTAERAAVRDPEDVAIELLATRLGAQQLDP